MAEEHKPDATPPAGTQPAEKPAADVKSLPPTLPSSSTTAETKPAVPAAPVKPVAPAKPAGPVPVPWDNEFIHGLKTVYESGIRETSTYLGQNYMVVDASILTEILQDYRDDEGFDYLVDLTAVHYPKREKAEFEIVYILYSFVKNERVRVKTQIADGESVPSATAIWPTANWLEREVFDMFGIRFEGHPDLKRILLPDGWKGHPLRKEYGILQQDKEWVQINLGIESGQ